MWWWNDLNLKKQIFIFTIILLIMVLIIVFYYFTHSQQQFYKDQLAENLHHKALLIKDNNNLSFQEVNIDRVDNWINELGAVVEARITIINSDGIVIADSHNDPRLMDNHLNRPEIRSISQSGDIGKEVRYSRTVEEEMFNVAVPFMEENNISGYIRVGQSLADINLELRNHTRNFLIFLSMIFLIVFLIVYKFADRFVQPLQQLTETAAEISQGKYHKRVRITDYGNEIGYLSEMFNHMANQLETKIGNLSEEENRVKTILQNMLDGVIAVDINKNIETLNPAAQEMLGLETDDYQQKSLIEVVPSYRLDEAITEALEENRVLSREINLKNPERYLYCQFAPLEGFTQNPTGGVIVLTDITKLRKLEQVRKDFVTNVSHELRTPLTSIIGYLDTLLAENRPEKETTEHFLEIIKEEADRMKLLIDDLFELTSIEDKDFQLEESELKPVFQKVEKMFVSRAREKNIELINKCPDDIEPVLMLPERIEQVLYNLVDNAVKYTPRGGRVELKAYSKKNKVVIEVVDNGPGIPVQDQHRIFERFYRVDKARSREMGGTGIGLSIVKHIIQGHHSEIEVESQEGAGSVFRFYLHKAK